MILKIRGHGDSWWIFDNLERVHYGFSSDQRVEYNPNESIPRQFSIRDSHEDTEGTELNPDFVVLTRPCDKARYCNWACARSGDREKFFVFDEAYLCNDGGKTLEVIRHLDVIKEGWRSSDK